MNIPQTAKKLNLALHHTFAIIEWDRAYIEFPFKITAAGEELHLVHRVSINNIGLVGDEALCCKQIWEALTDCISREELQDYCAMLILREPFSFRDEKGIFGRLAFYNPEHNSKLLSKRCCFRQGYIANEAIREEA